MGPLRVLAGQGGAGQGRAGGRHTGTGSIRRSPGPRRAQALCLAAARESAGSERIAPFLAPEQELEPGVELDVALAGVPAAVVPAAAAAVEVAQACKCQLHSGGYRLAAGGRQALPHRPRPCIAAPSSPAAALNALQLPPSCTVHSLAGEALLVEGGVGAVDGGADLGAGAVADLQPALHARKGHQQLQLGAQGGLQAQRRQGGGASSLLRAVPGQDRTGVLQGFQGIQC